MNAPDGEPPVIELQEADYRYGQGVLRIRVLAVDKAHPLKFDGQWWLTVDAVVVTSAGTAVRRRVVTVRASRIPPEMMRRVGG